MLRFTVLIIMFVFYNSFSQWIETDVIKGNLAIYNLLEVEDTIYTYNSRLIFKSTDGGENWKYLENDLYENIIKRSSTFAGIGKLHFNNNTFFATTYSGIFKSTNFGKNWFESDNGIYNQNNQYFNSYIDLKYCGSTLIAGNNFSLYQSTDNGENWSEIEGYKNLNVNRLDAFEVIDGILYVANDNGFYKSDDCGKTYEHLYNIRMNATVIKVTGNNIYAGSDTDGVFYSIDGGITWRNQYFATKVKDIEILDDKIIISTLQAGMYETLNNFLTVDYFDVNIYSESYGDILVFKNKILIASRGGINISNLDDFKWTISDLNTQKININSFCKDEYKIYCAADYNGIFESSDNGNTWRLHNDNFKFLTSQFNLLYSTKGHIFASTNSSGIYVFNNNGDKWYKSEDSTRINTSKITSFININDTIIAATSIGNFYSADFGKFWDTLNTPRFTLYEKHNNKIYAYLPNDKQIYVSESSVFDWEPLGSPLSNSFLDKIDMFFINSEPYVITNRLGILRFNNVESSWVPLNPKLKSHSLTSAISHGDNIFAASYMEGVLISRDKGQNWKIYKDAFNNFEYTSISDMIISGDYIYASTPIGLYKANLEDFNLTSVNRNIIATSFSISPNPAEDYIEISFSNKGLQPFANSGEIAIYDVLGNKVAQTFLSVVEQTSSSVVEQTSSSVHSGGTPELLRIDISHLPRGVYFVRIGNRTEKFVKK